MRKLSPPQAGPYRPDPAPHTWRTALIVGLCFLAIVVILAWMIGTDMARPLPSEIVDQAPVQTYDPGLYTPFTHAPTAHR